MIQYPNNIDHQPTRDKLRELIDRTNDLHARVAENQAAAEKTAASLAALPPSITSSDVSMLIAGGLLPNGSITKAIRQELKNSGITPASAPVARMNLQRAFSGVRTAAPSDLGPNDAGWLYYCTDYQRLVMWDGWSFWLADGGGGYFVDSPTPLGLGWALCDGSTTDYMLNDTPHLEVMPFTTPHYRSLRRGMRRYFRR